MSWNIKTPGDYINGPLTVAGASTFNSQVTVNSTVQVTGGVAGQGALIGRDGGSGGATYGSNAGNTNLNAPAGGGLRFNVNNGVFAGMFDTSGNMGILNSSPFSGTSNGLTIGTVGTGSAKQIALQMANCYARMRERNVVNDFSITTNINVDNVLDDNTRPSWMMRLGAGSDLFSVFRAPAGSTSFTTLATVNPSGDINLIGNLVLTNGKGIDFSSGSNAAGMTSELLNDYEEGTWTPALTFATPGTLSINYGNRNGNYTKVGNLVTARFAITINPAQFSKGTASGALIIGGLPFNIGSSGAYYFDLAANLADQNTGSFVLANPVGGTNQIYIESASVSGSRILRDYAAITAANFASSNSGYITVSAVIQFTV